jgi:DNA polymerase-3 subunit gamma/tau
MAYIPLHHKYRPQTFADLVGQEAIAKTLTNALNLQKIAPAYLFTGPRGTGKTSSARILAKSLNCISSPVPTAQPCGTCAVCSAIAVGSALDIIEIDAASNTGVDNIREIIERAQYAPVQCRYKVYIIDECHMLSTAAFNSLLKTLEEPPPHVVFVLATTDPQRVLPTIISRCQRFDYRRIPLDAMVGHLKYIADREEIGIHPESLTLVAQIAEGGLRDAESLLDRLSLLGGEITSDRVWESVGSVPERDLLGIVNAIALNNPELLLDRARHLLERGKEPLTILQNLAGTYRDFLIAKTAPQRQDLVALTAQTWQEMVQMAQTWDLNSILEGQQHLKESESQLKHTTQPRLWLEIALLGLLPRSIPTPHPTPHTPTPPTPNSQLSTPHTPNSQLPTPNSQLPTPHTPANLDLVWEQSLNLLPTSDRLLFQQFGKLIAITTEQVTIAMKSATMHQIAQGKVPELKKAFSAVLGRSIEVKLDVVGKHNNSPIATNPNPSPPSPPPSSLPVVTHQSTAPQPTEYLAEVEEEQPEADILPAPPPVPEPPEPLTTQQTAISVPTPPPPPMELRTNAIAPCEQPSLEVEDTTLNTATDRVVELFHGEILDREDPLFDLLT